jgi:hypothetical protein
VLTKVSEDAADCLRHAAACEAQAKLATDPTAKQSFLDLAARWRRMAETLDYIERVDRFLGKPEARGATVGGPPRRISPSH